MPERATPTCGKRRVPREWRATTFEYHEDGITIRVPNVYAWICPEDGEIAFTPDTAEELMTTIRELVATAKRARERQSSLTEYLVVVG
jgi:YgiT-type zinc finger domain-containing protein